MTDGIPAMASLLEAARAAGLFIVHTRIECDDSPDAVHLIHNVVAQTFGAVADAPGRTGAHAGDMGRGYPRRARASTGRVRRHQAQFLRVLSEPILRRRCGGAASAPSYSRARSTYACVLHTAFDANVRDLDVIVASDGTSSWAPDLQGPTLRIVDLILGGTAATGEIIEALAIARRGTAG